MPAAVIKGIIVSISIITALGVAVLENPQIQVWLEQQRQRLVELLRSIGEELDPQSRRTAEAFAYEGLTPATDDGSPREVSGSEEAVAVATGRALSSPSTIRRIPVKGPADTEEAEERRRKGREYLAKRNQQMYELQQRKKRETGEVAATPPSPTSFDAIVDEEGKLRLSEAIKELPPMPESDPVPEPVVPEMRKVNRSGSHGCVAKKSALLELEAPAGPSTGAAGWSFGSLLANPFSDENALDRSDTPKPPVPPKVALEVADGPSVPTLPGSFPPGQSSPHLPQRTEELSYEEQMAIALSLSEAEAAKPAEPTPRDIENFNLQLRAAIEASLKDHKVRQAPTEIVEVATPRAIPEVQDLQPLVDLTPPSPTIRPQEQIARPRWQTMFDQEYSPSHEPLSLASKAPQPEEEDELYRVTPELTHARLATFNSQRILSTPSTQSTIPYDPVREAAGQSHDQQQVVNEASFYSATSSAKSPASSHTMDYEHTPEPIQLPDDLPAAGTQTPTSRTSHGFQAETDSDSETFASILDPTSRAQSRPLSVTSDIEVLDMTYDSDVDMLSDQEGDGIRTPDTDNWTEVGSRDGDSEEDEQLSRQVLISSS